MLTLVSSSQAIFRNFQWRSGQGRIKNQSFKFINVDKTGVYVDQFLLRNLIVSFIFTYDPRKFKKNRIWKSDDINWYDFGDKNSAFGG